MALCYHNITSHSKANLLLFYYLHEDVEFGRLQARDMLQHLWTGPISNAAVDVVQGSRSVEVRSVGVTKVCECRLVGHENIFIHLLYVFGTSMLFKTKGVSGAGIALLFFLNEPQYGTA